ncbi:uncharacterized protein LOC132555146 [Ylistrum balloti]|uniref:uncharacterized protein LOC132555146 n=1 Tax=Ylistrum balloti TaxID=509963 RepID=UPI002905CA67|nr:uncharacterized protein LOC132555146 [Ylistrum balloti]
MRFFPRRYRPSVRTVFQENSSSHLNFNPFQKCQFYIPKCLSATSPSDILNGADVDEVEDFSAGCWLQDHLHQFGNGITQLVTTTSSSQLSYSTDSWTCSESDIDITTEASENEYISMAEDLDENYVEYRPLFQFQSASISRYTMVQEPPPYGFDEPPPSYEEAIRGYTDQTSERTNSSNCLRNFDVLF